MKKKKKIGKLNTAKTDWIPISLDRWTTKMAEYDSFMHNLWVSPIQMQRKLAIRFGLCCKEWAQRMGHSAEKSRPAFTWMMAIAECVGSITSLCIEKSWLFAFWSCFRCHYKLCDVNVWAASEYKEKIEFGIAIIMKITVEKNNQGKWSVESWQKSWCKCTCVTNRIPYHKEYAKRERERECANSIAA